MNIASVFRTFCNRDVYISTVEINHTGSVKYRGHCIRDLDGMSLSCNCRFYSLSETVLDASSADELHWGNMEYVSVCLSVGVRDITFDQVGMSHIGKVESVTHC